MCSSMSAIGVNFDGGFAQYSVVPSEQCLVVAPELGRKLGADDAIDPMVAPISEHEAITGFSGADVVIECVGNAKATEQAFKAADKGATIVLFSVSSPDRTYAFNAFDAFRRGLTIKTSFVNPDTHLRAVQLLNSGRIRTKEVITHRFSLKELDLAIHKQIDNDSVKVVVVL